MPLNPGDTLGNNHYCIVRQLGRGGFGFVYLADDTLLGEQVAIKELIPALVGEEVTLKRFLAEARATMRLRHERIVATHNVFRESGNYYIVMECMAGDSLEPRLRERGPLPVDEAVQVAAEVCEGLAHAHERGVVHCDLKPANILFDKNGRAKVADFGIAHVSGEMLTRTWKTPQGFVAGTLPYMSPEQADGVRDDPRIDIYALGAVLYRMLTGRVYLDLDSRETPGATADNVLRIRNKVPAPPSAHNRTVPSGLDAVILKALSKRPGDRHASANEMRAALLRQQAAAVAPLPTQSAAGRQAPAGRSEGAIPAARRASALPAWFWPAVGGVGVLLVFLIVAFGTLARDRDGAETATPLLTRAVAEAVTVAPALPPTENVIQPETPKGAATPFSTAPHVNTPELAGSFGSVQITIQPQQGYINTLISVTGQGWWAGEPVFVFLRSPAEAEREGYAYAAAVADESGNFRTVFTFPNETRWMDYEWAEVIARGSHSQEQATARFALITPAATARGKGRIAFTSKRDGNLEIYVMNADGSGQTRLTNSPAQDFSPAWSPDGKRIAFTSERDGNAEIYVMNADGSGQTRLTSNLSIDWLPAWSPDGMRITFASHRDGNREVYVMNADGTEQTRLTNNPAEDYGPAPWSPDGKRIAFYSDRSGNPEIYVMNPDGGGLSRLTNHGGTDSCPAWSPDGKRIAFYSARNGSYSEIYVMNADGTEQIRLTNNGADDYHPAWSPDGKRIAFATFRDGNWDIYIMNSDGSGQTRLSSNPARDYEPDWSP